MADATSRVDRRHELRRALILDAAAKEFAEHGYADATLDRIGDRIGLSKASLYHYVQGKQDLLASLLEQATEHISVEARLEEGASATDRLRAFVRAHVRAATSGPGAAVLSENLDALMRQHASPHLADVRRRHEQRLTEILQDGVDSGEFAPILVRPAVKLLFGALNGIPRWFDRTGPLELDELCDLTVQMVLDGLSASDV